MREINTHNTAISAIDIEFHPDHNNCFHQSGRSWPNSIGFARLAQTNTYITKWSPLHMIVFSSHRRSFCIYYKVISPPLDHFCLLIKDHFEYITKRSPHHMTAFSLIIEVHLRSFYFNLISVNKPQVEGTGCALRQFWTAPCSRPGRTFYLRSVQFHHHVPSYL